MKQVKIFALILVLSVVLLTGCSGGSTETTDSDKINIVCTTYPLYDWVHQVIGEESNRFQITLLIDGSYDMHSYQPSTADLAKIKAADVFLYIGGSSDSWVTDALKDGTNENQMAVNMVEVLGNQAKTEEVVEGMEAEEDEEHEEAGEIDEHVWLSLKNAKILTSAIAGAVEKVDEENADIYKENADAYKKQLTSLDKEYEKMVASADKKTILFGDRFPFRYLVDDYGISYYAAFVGCSAETEASFETITFLAGKIDEEKLSSIMVIENSDQKIANTIKKNTKDKNQEILELNSLQSVNDKDTTYLDVMKDNLKVLEKALN